MAGVEPEEKSLMDDMRDDAFRFAHDVLSEVLRLTAKIVQRGVDFPKPGKFLLTADRKLIIQNFLRENGKYFDSLVEDYACRINDVKFQYGELNYAHNKIQILNGLKPVPYNEEGFVKFCAALAQVAVLNYMRDRECEAMRMAQEDVHHYVQMVLSRGTLENSSWPEN